MAEYRQPTAQVDTSAEIYDPEAGTSSATGSLSITRLTLDRRGEVDVVFSVDGNAANPVTVNISLRDFPVADPKTRIVPDGARK